jgi:hypothetical protein
MSMTEWAFWTEDCSSQLEYILENGSENLPARGVVDTIINLRTKTTTVLHLLTFCDWSAHRQLRAACGRVDRGPQKQRIWI